MLFQAFFICLIVPESLPTGTHPLASISVISVFCAVWLRLQVDYMVQKKQEKKKCHRKQDENVLIFIYDSLS